MHWSAPNLNQEVLTGAVSTGASPKRRHDVPTSAVTPSMIAHFVHKQRSVHSVWALDTGLVAEVPRGKQRCGKCKEVSMLARVPTSEVL